MLNIKVTRNPNPKPKVTDESKLGFGEIMTDHMFVMTYTEGQGWHDPEILPYGPLDLDPAAMVLHYGQEVFEGMKGYRAEDGRLLLFRPDENYKRMQRSCHRLCMPEIPVEDGVQATMELLKVDQDWMPTAPNTSMYIRPFMISTEPKLGVRASSEYKFVIIMSPSGPYYKTGLGPVDIYVETKYVRAVKGGTGEAKTAGNYAASLIGQVEAKKDGYSQVLWLDGIDRKYVEEIGTSNAFFVIDDEIITPDLSQGTTLPGITRKSVIELARSWGMKVTERRITIDEVYEAYQSGHLKEVFSSGTAAVISPVGHLKWGEHNMDVAKGEIGPITKRLYDELTDIQYGRKPGPAGWSVEVK